MKIATSELEHLREEVKNCHQIIKDLQKKREFVGLRDEDYRELHLEMGPTYFYQDYGRAIEAKLKQRNK